MVQLSAPSCLDGAKSTAMLNIRLPNHNPREPSDVRLRSKCWLRSGTSHSFRDYLLFLGRLTRFRLGRLETRFTRRLGGTRRAL